MAADIESDGVLIGPRLKGILRRYQKALAQQGSLVLKRRRASEYWYLRFFAETKGGRVQMSVYVGPRRNVKRARAVRQYLEELRSKARPTRIIQDYLRQICRNRRFTTLELQSCQLGVGARNRRFR